MKKNIILSFFIVLFGALCFYLGSSLNINGNNFESKEGYFIEQGYSFKTPSWAETEELGITAFLNENEDNGENPFKSYVFFIKDDLTGRTYEQYIDYIKTQVENSSEGVETVEEKDEENSHVLILKTNQEEVNYIIAMSFIKGLNDTIFVVSLNTLESRFEETKPVFEEIYKSFTLR